MKISTTKPEVSINPDQCSLQVSGASLKQVENFKYLGGVFTSEGSMSVGSGGQGAMPSTLWIFIHGTDIVDRGLIL